MAAPRFAPSRRRSDPFYESPDVVPASWSTDRPAEIEGLQPVGPSLGYPGPDQGFILTIAQRLRPRICTQSGEHIDDAINGSIGIALRRASMISRLRSPSGVGSTRIRQQSSSRSGLTHLLAFAISVITTVQPAGSLTQCQSQRCGQHPIRSHCSTRRSGRSSQAPTRSKTITSNSDRPWRSNVNL